MDIVKKMDEKTRGEQSYAELTMKIVRPDWEREVKFKSWALGEDYMLMYITSPARDKGTAFLKRNNEIWNWQPRIKRSIKLPPSMMMQAWMGSDFTNDDLVRQSSIIYDFKHELLGEEVIQERDCHIVELIPSEEADVVWGKIVMWIDKKEYIQLKTEFYDEDDYLINTMIGENIKLMDGRLLPTRLVVRPEEDDGNLTIVEYTALDFDEKKSPSFFSIQNLKRIR